VPQVQLHLAGGDLGRHLASSARCRPSGS
jgi:hypothetical protein